MNHIAFFSTKAYDKRAFEPFLIQHQGALTCNYFEASLSPETASLAHGHDAVCTFVNDNICSDTLRALHAAGVKHVALRCAGFNQVDVETAKALNIAISRVPAYSPEAVAEHTIALILTLNRRLHKAYNRVREGNFSLDGLQGFTLHGKTVGIVGTGKIGLATIKILAGFGCNILCYDIAKNPEAEALGARYVDIPELLSSSHIVSLHCPLNEDTHHIINDDAIARMREKVMLINTSRGGLVDTHAIIQGLKKGKIGYLGLDVYEMESELFFRDLSDTIIQDDVFERLATFPNVLITGHQGFFTHEALEEIARVTVENLVHFSKGQLDGARRVV
ncbi:2-hydroxyacid dehydrogenase [Alteromonas sediminis]|uniref:2-hydroxyacid dehydrogenase n=2 Tax=Alteromonas sediminis TaxID=2259342 RepID=A0A3N5ZCN8_9ALTE|nr:2-hydroxyacid dehydrogenase [Alteromonas sediminis]RPJ67688.1 2-hydroxyacid dehydrogenase [Alteromonas sediminis]